LGRYWKRRF